MKTQLFTNSAKTGPEKQACEFTFSYLTNIKDTLNSLTIKTGQGNSGTVKWIPLELAFERNIKTGLIKNLRHLDFKPFLDDAFEVFKQEVSKIIREKGAVKVYTVLVSEYQVQTENKSLVENKYFNTAAASIFPTTNMQEWLGYLLKEVEEFQENGSGWSLKAIQCLKVHISKYNPIHAGSSYFRLPQEIINKKSCINIENKTDDMCFKWCILLGHMKNNKNYSTTYRNHLERVKKYKDYEKKEKINLVENFEYPMDPANIPKFEKDNEHLDISVNIFIMQLINKKYIISPYHLTKFEKTNYANLLLAQDHYYDEGDMQKKDEE